MNQFHGIFFGIYFLKVILMENVKKNFVIVIYLISRVFLARTFLNFLAHCAYLAMCMKKTHLRLISHHDVAVDVREIKSYKNLQKRSLGP